MPLDRVRVEDFVVLLPYRGLETPVPRGPEGCLVGVGGGAVDGGFEVVAAVVPVDVAP